MKNFDPARRDALKTAGIAGVGAIAASLVLGGVAKAAAKVTTPTQPEGPFYPIRDQLDKDADMTKVVGRSERAAGQNVRLAGRVIDASTSTPVAGAIVEFWQACESGRYNHPRDPNDAPLDPNFQYWAQVLTDNEGRFGLLTIKPGAYPADDTWIRPPHIHIKVHKPGYPSLTTQIYFAGEPLNSSDQILQKLTPNQRAFVTVDFKKDPATEELEGDWSIFIAPFVQGKLLNGDSEALSTTPDID